MYVIISDNLECYSDHEHTTVLVCETEEQAKKASDMLLEWVKRASNHYWSSTANCRYEVIEKPPCGVDANWLQIPSRRWSHDNKEFIGTISYFEIPKWVE